MEFFDYADWRAEGRRKARAIGNPDLDTERLYLHFRRKTVYIYYTVDLKTVPFEELVGQMSLEQFSRRFFNMLEVQDAS